VQLHCPVITFDVASAGDPDAGIRLYERALAFNPRYPDALYNLGVACGEAGLSDRAVFAYEMAAQLNPSCAEVPPLPCPTDNSRTPALELQHAALTWQLLRSCCTICTLHTVCHVGSSSAMLCQPASKPVSFCAQCHWLIYSDVHSAGAE
jgi:tetratricopeptide (TPR) repeat protein